MAGLYLTGSKRVAWVGPKTLLDVVKDIDTVGRVEYLKEARISLSRGKAFDARLQMPSENFSGPHGGKSVLPAGGIKGRRSYAGQGSLPSYSLVGITKNIHLQANILNKY